MACGISVKRATFGTTLWEKSDPCWRKPSLTCCQHFQKYCREIKVTKWIEQSCLRWWRRRRWWTRSSSRLWWPLCPSSCRSSSPSSSSSVLLETFLWFWWFCSTRPWGTPPTFSSSILQWVTDFQNIDTFLALKQRILLFLPSFVPFWKGKKMICHQLADLLFITLCVPFTAADYASTSVWTFG